MNDFIVKNISYILALFLFMMVVSTCNTCRLINTVNGIANKETKEIQCVSLDEIKELTDAQFKEVLKDFLRYEEDIDKKIKSVKDVMSEIDKK
jgi:hypothetical protein